MFVLAVTCLLVTALLALADVPPNFGPGGIYNCKCRRHYYCWRIPDSGECRWPGLTCSDGSQYAEILRNCQIESLAFRKSVYQQSTLIGEDLNGEPEKAVDGRAYPSQENSSCSHTDFKKELCDGRSPVTWWRVNLGEVRDISAVWILNRLENPHHLANIIVRVSNEDRDWQNAEICYSFKDPPVNLWHRKLCDKPLRGQFVRIEKTACTQGHIQPVPYLILCEVLVIDKLYIAASDVALTTSTVKFFVNEMFYGGIVSYRVSLITRGLHDCPQRQDPTIQEQDFPGNEIELSGLSSYWDYEIKIQPVAGSMSYGPSTDFSFTTTGEKPLTPPSGIGLQQHNSRDVRIKWNGLNCSSWMGNRRRYEILIVQRVDFILTYNNIVETTEVFFNSLKPWTDYIAKVRSVNSYGATEWASFDFKTKPDKPTAPRNVRVTDYTNTSVTVTWALPEHHYGPPGKYLITIINLHTSTTEVRAATRTSSLITGLDAGGEYAFSVRASTLGAGEGPESNTVKQHTRPPNPAKFTTELQMDANGITLFLPGVEDRRFFVGYIVLVDDQTSVRRRSVSSYCREASSSAYITANLTHIPATGLNFTVGDNTTLNGVWNRPLTTDRITLYIAAVNRFHSDESSRCSYVNLRDTDGDSSSSNTAAVAGSVVCLVVVVGGIVVILVVIRYRRISLKRPECVFSACRGNTEPTHCNNDAQQFDDERYIEEPEYEQTGSHTRSIESTVQCYENVASTADQTEAENGQYRHDPYYLTPITQNTDN